MTKTFQAASDGFLLVPIPAGMPTQATGFGVFVTNGGDEYEVEFNWNGYYQHYSYTIASRAQNRRLIQHWPRVDEFVLVRNFYALDRKNPDAMVASIDTSLQKVASKPSTFGNYDLMIVIRGAVR